MNLAVEIFALAFCSSMLVVEAVQVKNHDGAARSYAGIDGYGSEAAVVTADGWARAHQLNSFNNRVDRSTFVTTCMSTAPASFLNQKTDFEQYLNDIFDLGLKMMLPAQKNDLGRHCFSYGYLLSKEFYGDAPADVLGLVSGASPDLDADWAAVEKDGEGRVTSAAFKTVMKSKHGSKVSDAEASSFDAYLDQAFKVGQSMMLPEVKSTLGGHCFRYAALAAGEFYFGGKGEDVLGLTSAAGGVRVASEGWALAHENIAPSARVGKDRFIQTAMKTAPLSFLSLKPAFMEYLSAIFEMSTGMMLPNVKSDLGRHCFSYGYMMSKEFYGEDGSSLDVLNLKNGARPDLDADWTAVENDGAGRVTQAAFKDAMKQKHGSKVDTAHEAAFDTYLDQAFTVGLSMMLPAEKSSLGGHCFRYAALAAGEFYFTDKGADVLGLTR